MGVGVVGLVIDRLFWPGYHQVSLPTKICVMAAPRGRMAALAPTIADFGVSRASESSCRFNS